MVGLNGILGIPQPANTNQPKARGGVRDDQGNAAQDSVELSNQTQEASRADQLAEQSKAESEVRAERVAKAKENIENGTYKMQSVVRIVAARMSKYIYENA